MTEVHNLNNRRRPEKTLWTAHPSWRGMVGWYLKWQGLALVVSALLFLAYRQDWVGWPIAVFVIVVLNGLVLMTGRLLRMTTTYTITSKRVSGRKRIPSQLFRLVQEEAPISRIDNVIVDQSLLEQMLGIGKIDFDTAGDVRGDILRWWGVANPRDVASKIEHVASGDIWDEEDPESPYFQAEPRLATRGYVEEE
jgi:uncharacterized membrane protein YdbT with pleckstrin-like domain